MSNNASITDGSIDEIWKEALQIYQQTTSQKLEPIEDVQNPAELEQLIEREIGAASVSREKHAKLVKIFQAVLIPVQLTTNVLTGSENTFGPGAFVFNAMRILIRAIKDVTTRLDGIEDLLSKIQHFTARLSIYTSDEVSLQLRKLLVEVLATLIEVFAFCTKGIKLGRFRTFGKNALLGEDRQLRDVMSKLDRLTSVESQLVGAETYSLVSRQKQAVEKIAATTTEILDEVKRQGGDGNSYPRSHESAAGNKIYKLLLPISNPHDIFDRIGKERLTQTGEWLRDDTTFQSWLRKSVPVLWMSGVSGSGKSFLSQSVASYLQEHHKTPEKSVAYFFFRDDDAETRSLSQALRSIAYQVSANDSEYARYLMGVEARDIKSTESAWRVLFMNFFKSRQSYVYMVLDGIDEADESDRGQLLSILQDLATAPNPTPISVFLTGRPHLSDQVADTLKAPSISVDTRNAADITEFTEQSIVKSRLLRRVSDELQKEILDTLVSEAKGMFFWVDLMLKDLKTKPNAAAIQNALHQAPRGLKDMLSHVFAALRASLPHDNEQLMEIFTWITFAKRNPTIEELNDLLQYVSASMLLLERKLRKDWASFLELLREDGRSTEELEALFADADDEFESKPFNTFVMFRHTSIGDFFHSTDTLGADASARVLKTVLALLCDESAPSSIRQYAQQNWLDHLQSVHLSTVPLSTKADIGTSLIQICRNENIIDFWSKTTRSTFWEHDNLETFRRWLWDDELLKSLPFKHREWIESLKQPVDLFDEKARLITHRWLHNKHWAPDACFQTVSVYLITKKELDDSMDLETQIRKSAEWADLEKTPLWHHRLGVTFRKLSLLSAAQEQFEAAIQLNPSMTLAYGGLALVYEERGDLENALKLWEKAIQVMDQDEDHEDGAGFAPEAIRRRQEATFYKCLGDAYSALGREDEAFKEWQQSWEKDAGYHFALEDGMKYLGRRSEDKRIMETLVYLRAQNQLTSWILALTIGSLTLRICRWAARAQNQMDFWIGAVQETLAHCRREKFPVGEIFTEIMLADILYFERIDPARAITIWEKVESVGIPKPQTNMWLLKLFSLHRLATPYFLAGDVDQLKRLTSHKMYVGRAWFHLGHWYESQGQHEDALQCFSYLADKGKELSDEGDHEVYKYASYILLYLHQEDDAIAVMRKAFARTGTETKPDRPDRVWCCDGDCSPHQGYSSADPVWVCRECFDVGLCTQCAGRQQARTLKTNICKPGHELLRADLGDDIMPAYQILINGELVNFDEWAGQQREKLGI